MNEAAAFQKHLKAWREETVFRSAGIFDGPHFQAIVAMGESAVPFIVAELGKGPSHLVHALDLIFPGVVECEGFVPLEEAQAKWLEILNGMEQA